MAESTTTPPVVCARDDGWGDDKARQAIRVIAEDARQRTDFGTCEVEVLRPDDMLEFVAIAGNDDADDEMLRRASPFAAMNPALNLGAEYGAWTFVATEWLTPEARRLLDEYCWIPETAETSDPDLWRPYDILVARIVDDRGHLRALMYLDEPNSGKRLGPPALLQLASDLQLSLRAVLTAIEREELSQQVRLTEAARRELELIAELRRLDSDRAELIRTVSHDLKNPLGTGLGLAIVARIATRHGGRIDVDSTLGVGTTFRVTLPGT